MIEPDWWIGYTAERSEGVRKVVQRYLDLKGGLEGFEGAVTDGIVASWLSRLKDVSIDVWMMTTCLTGAHKVLESDLPNESEKNSSGGGDGGN